MCKKNKYRIAVSLGSTIFLLIIFILTNNYPPHTREFQGVSFIKN